LLVDALKIFRERVVKQFCAVMEFKAFTDLAYQVTSKQANTMPPDWPSFVIGYSTFAHSFGLSDLTIKAKELPTHLTRAKDEYLAPLMFQNQVALFEYLFFDMLRLLLVDKPLHLPSNRKIEYSEIFDAQTKEEIIGAMVDRELNELKFKNVQEWFLYLEKLVSDCKTSACDQEHIAEAKATRDLLVHNAGVVNDIYLKKAGNHARYKIGENVHVGGDYSRDIWQLLLSALLGSVDCLISKFEAKPPIG